MKVKEAIKELEKMNPDMDLVDYDGYVIESIRYKKIYDSQYPYHEVEHLAVCADCDDNKFILEDLKDIISNQIYDYKGIYDGENDSWVKAILDIPKKFDKQPVYTKWKYYGQNERNFDVFKLVNFSFFDEYLSENGTPKINLLNQMVKNIEEKVNIINSDIYIENLNGTLIIN